jgi:hypothetical protein
MKEDLAAARRIDREAEAIRRLIKRCEELLAEFDEVYNRKERRQNEDAA